MEKQSSWWQRVRIVLLVALVVIALDQWTKILVRQRIPKFDSVIPIPALGEYFVFQHVENYGAAFGILQNKGYFFIIIAAVVAIAILFYARTLPLQQRFMRVLLGLQLGGALGNVLDRLYQGYVTDFIKMGIPGVYYWPNYNIADSSIVVGVIALGIYIFTDDMRRERTAPAETIVSSSSSASASENG